MKKSIFLTIALVVSLPSFGQIKSNIGQYMLNQMAINPGYIDMQTRYGGVFDFRRQWMTNGSTPYTFTANGHYALTRNHTIGGIAQVDLINSVNTIDIGAIYNYKIWLTKKMNLGFGVKIGYQQRSILNDYVYFSESEPILTNRSTGGFNMGGGLSLQTKNFDFGFSAPSLFDNFLANKAKIYSTASTNFYSHIGYKIRVNDDLVVYPSVLARTTIGSAVNLSIDAHILAGQFFWFGGGYHSDNSASVSAGVFLEKGLRIIYTYETSYFSSHSTLSNTHEVSLNYARSIADSPFARRQYTKRKGGAFRKHPRKY